MCMSVCLHVCVCTICVPSARGGQKNVPNPLDLELEVCVSAGNWTQILCKISQSS